MKNLLRSVILFFLFLFELSAFSQNTTVSIGSWREHTPFIKGINVVEDSKGVIYCASQFGIFSYSKNDGELNILSRLKELSDLEITTIRFE